MKIIPLAATLAIGLPAPAFAQEASAGVAETPSSAPEAPAAQAATAKAGDTIYDSSGEVVGTVESVSGANFVISTGASKATLPLAAVASGPKGPTISMNKAQLEAAVAAASKSN